MVRAGDCSVVLTSDPITTAHFLQETTSLPGRTPPLPGFRELSRTDIGCLPLPLQRPSLCPQMLAGQQTDRQY